MNKRQLPVIIQTNAEFYHFYLENILTDFI